MIPQPSRNDPRLRGTNNGVIGGGAYVIDRWKLNDRLTIKPQARVVGYEGTQTDWSARLQALCGLDSNGRNPLRIGGAKAFRSPYPGVRDAMTSRTPIAPGVYAFNLLPPANKLENEQVTAFEVGLISNTRRA